MMTSKESLGVQVTDYGAYLHTTGLPQICKPCRWEDGIWYQKLG